MDLDALNGQALSQFGLLTRQQLLSHGVSARFVEWRLSSKRWVAVFPGVYLTSPRRNDWSVRSMAAVLHVGEDAVLSHASAAFSYGLGGHHPTGWRFSSHTSGGSGNLRASGFSAAGSWRGASTTERCRG